jgi:hypothetical protein
MKTSVRLLCPDRLRAIFRLASIVRTLTWFCLLVATYAAIFITIEASLIVSADDGHQGINFEYKIF